MNHHIRTLTVDLRLAPDSDAFEIQQQVSQFCRRAIEPTIEPILDEFSVEKSIQIDRLEVDLGAISFDTRQWENLLTDALRDALRKSIQEWLATAPADRVQSLPESVFTHWLHFLQTGRLGWSSRNLPTGWQMDVLAILSSRQGAIRELQQCLKLHPEALQRLIQQHSALFLKQIIECATAQPQQLVLTGLSELIRVVEHVRTNRVLAHELALQASSVPFLAELKQGVSPRKLELYFWHFILTETILRASQPTDVDLLQHTWQAFFGTLPRLTNSVKRKKRQFPTLSKVLSSIRQSDAPPGEPLTDKPDRSGQNTPTSSQPNTQSNHPLETPNNSLLTDSPTTESSSDTDRVKVIAQKDYKQTGVAPDASNRETRPSSAESTNQSEPSESFTNLITSFKSADKEQLINQLDNSAELLEGVFLNNAGIVLLYPFISSLFQQVDYLEGKDFKDEIVQQKAMLMLHYAATGETSTLEYDLLLPKLLCGWPLNQPLDHTLGLDQSEIDEINELLYATIEHWGALGSASPEALREGFLRRPGKLRRLQGVWWLHMETNTLDILLDRLPYTWGFNHIMLPWMPELLRVEWR
ncbi:contractile injection system tape measure protein [Spirosoma panaciterrae]|uniref:contractile injection system tape measure protein n=1 Tax=Spirosoma panaciterrae TaxID=496058 RepID=UPI000365CDFE|nr:contractile injection system tape measure protein [Spirosoma panaciterrae]